jgi:hypothetical protein
MQSPKEKTQGNRIHKDKKKKNPGIYSNETYVPILNWSSNFMETLREFGNAYYTPPQILSYQLLKTIQIRSAKRTIHMA